MNRLSPPRFPSFLLAAILALGGMSAELCARPLFVAIDAAQADAKPELFGYHVTATAEKDSVRFTVLVDAASAALLHRASIFNSKPAPEMGPIAVEVKELPGHRRQLTFSLPEKFVNDCYLYLKSEPVRPGDSLDNFDGYRLRLGSIPR